MADFNSFIQHFPDAKEKPYGSGQWKCRCPAHDDKKASLSIRNDTDRTGRILLKCHAGCRTEDILSRVGLKLSDLQPKTEKKQLQNWQRNLVAEYRYLGRNGNYLFSKLRYEGGNIKGKEIRYGRTNGMEFQAGKGNAKATLYRLPELLKGIRAGRRIYIVEGEKDVETLHKFGIVATTAGGSEDWKSEYADYFIGASEVVIIADRDPSGQKLSQQISKDIKSVVYSHKIITPSGLQHGDVTDYLKEEDGTIEDLLEMVEAAEPITANWVTGGKSKTTINVDLLAAEILKKNRLFIARNPGTKSDLIFWYENGCYRQMSETEVSGIVRTWLPMGKATPDTISKVTKMLIYSAEIKSYDELNKDEHYINLKNGLFDIHNGKLIAHDADLISTLQLNCSYDVKAYASRWECFIEMLCWNPENEEPDEEMIKVLQEWTGLIISPIYGYRVKKALMLYSAQGNTGKSVFLSVIGELLGKDALANISFKDLGSSRWATGRAFSKRCLAIGDEGGDRVESSAIFKQLTGGDVVSAEMKGLQGFDFRFRGIIAAACNVLPFFDDDKGNHIADRLMLLNCRCTVPEEERDPLLFDRLVEERDGILQWALAGLKRFIDNGMRFSRCRSSEELINEYRKRYDTMYAFLQDTMEVTNDRHDVIRKTELEDEYFLYCQERDLSSLSKKNIPQRLASLGVPKAVRDGYTVFVGIRHKTFIELDPDMCPSF